MAFYLSFMILFIVLLLYAYTKNTNNLKVITHKVGTLNFQVEKSL